MKLSQKKRIADDLHEKFSACEILILTDFKGLDVVTMNDLRTRLRAEGVEYRVVKNTLLARAAKGTSAERILDKFKGPSAVALSPTDPVAPAKILVGFAKENDKFKIKVGLLNDKVLDPDAVKALSNLPSRDVLLAQLLSVMNAVPTALVTALSDMPRRFLNVLNAIKEQKET
jgi:large subunit ribosomal protein L10